MTRYPIKELFNGVRQYLQEMPASSRHRRVTFEYVMLDGVNDTLADAKSLVKLLSHIPAHVNLIPFNPWPGTKFKSSSWAKILAFQECIRDQGRRTSFGELVCTIRKTRGNDILGACGQLNSSNMKKKAIVLKSTIIRIHQS